MLSVLLVDDDETVLDALPRTLELRLPALKVQTCPSAQVALQRLTAEPYDVLISDVWMPGVDGLALLREAKRVRASLPVILLTATLDVKLGIQALEAGACDVMAKPIVREEFVNVVRSAVELHRLVTRIEAERQRLARLARRLRNLEQHSRDSSNMNLHTTDPSQTLIESSRKHMDRSLVRAASALQRLACRVKLVEYGIGVESKHLERVQHETRQRAWERLHALSRPA
jgi:FixJ family two-component response regulator